MYLSVHVQCVYGIVVSHKSLFSVVAIACNFYTQVRLPFTVSGIVFVILAVLYFALVMSVIEEIADLVLPFLRELLDYN